LVCLNVALTTFDDSLQEARQNGTLENLLVTQTSLPVILAGSCLYPFVLMSLRTAIYIGWGAILFGFPLRGANWLGALLVLAASVLAFLGLGILSASYLLILKRGNQVNWAILGLSSVAGGMMYPISVLPAWLQRVAHLIPVTYSLEGMRAAILGHASMGELLPSIAVLGPPADKFSILGSTASEFSPVTEILNTPADFIVVRALESAFPNLAVYDVNDFTVLFPNVFPYTGNQGATFAEGNGTTGIVVDNVSTSEQASSIYFGVPSLNTAVKLTQCGLN
jgi:ABC-type transport system involved in cytochrome c biogenesis permease component